MELSAIKNKISSFANDTAERVKSNWDNLSTTKKIATVAFSILVVGAAIAAQFLGAGLLSATAALSLSASHLVAHIATPALAALGLGTPACLLLKKEKAKPVAVKEEVVLEQQPTQEIVQPGRLANLKNTSVQFVRNHPRLVIAGSVLAIGLLSAGLMGSQRRDAIASYSRATIKALPTTSREFGKNALTKSKKTVDSARKTVAAGLLRVQSKFSFAKKAS